MGEPHVRLPLDEPPPVTLLATLATRHPPRKGEGFKKRALDYFVHAFTIPAKSAVTGLRTADGVREKRGAGAGWV